MNGITQASVRTAVPSSYPHDAMREHPPGDPRRFLLAREAHVAWTADWAVILHHGCYIAFGRPELRAFAAGIRGWPTGEQSCDALSDRQSEFLEQLVRRGLLTLDSAHGKAAHVAEIAAPTSSYLNRDLDGDEPRITRTHIRRFYGAMLAGRIREIRRPLESLARWVRLRRARAMRREFVANADMHEHVQIFRHLRPLLFAGRDRCKLDALALFEFLAASRVDVTRTVWVVGVCIRPWAAHCWLQQDGVVISDTCERVQRYTPILIA